MRKAYCEETISFHYGNTTLAGVLCLPLEPSPHPAIVYIPGSGPTTRDGLGMLPQHWEACARHGIASLSWDKAGVGDSTGDWTAQTMDDRAKEV